MSVILTTTANLNTNGADALERYASVVIPLIEAARGRVLARGVLRDTIVGSDCPGFIAVMQFPDAESVHAMFDSDAYHAAIADRTLAFRDLRTFVSEPV
jgi:uncharacterized protein (DUF1330 family)